MEQQSSVFASCILMAPSYVLKWKLTTRFLLPVICCLLSFFGATTSSTVLKKTLDFSDVRGIISGHKSPSTSSTTKSSFQISEDLKSTGFRAELLHRDALSSPLRKTHLSRLERLRLAVSRSKARAKALAAMEKLSESSAATHGTTSNKLSPSQLDFTTPVASANGAYTMQIKLGTPAQTFHSIADTGSDLVWVQCNPCTRCYSQSGPRFSPSSSSSYAKLSCSSQECQQLSTSSCGSSSCQYSYQYGDQSGTKGDFSTETISMTTTGGGTKQIADFAFGCGHTNVGTFGGAGGIVGLGQGPVSLTSQLGSLIDNRFSYCLVTFDDSSSQTSPLFFGSAASLPESGAKSTPILKQGSTYYYVGLNDISVGGQTLGISLSGGTIIDSGTTLTLLEDSAYQTVRSAFLNDISLSTVDGSSYGFDLCFDVTGMSSVQVPSLSLHLKNSDLDPPASNYFVLVDSDTICLAFSSSSGLGISIIGNLMQQNYHILYDRSTSTISYAPKQCDTL